MADQDGVYDLEIRYELPRDEQVKPSPLNSGVTVPSTVLVAAELPGQPDMNMRFEVESGKLVLTRLELVRPDSQLSLSQATVRELPLSAIIKEVRRRLVAAFSVLDQLGDGAGVVTHIAGPPGPGSSDHADAGPATSRRRAVDGSLLAEVAAVVAAHPTRPTRAVQEKLGTSHRNATRWIAAARQRGLLEEALQVGTG